MSQLKENTPCCYWLFLSFCSVSAVCLHQCSEWVIDSAESKMSEVHCILYTLREHISQICLVTKTDRAQLVVH